MLESRMHSTLGKTIIIILFVSLTFSCNEKKYDYNANLAILKTVISEINEYFIEDSNKTLHINKYYTEDFIFHSYPAGKKKGVKTSKIDYINNLDEMKKMNMLLNIDHSIYLPGINEKSHQLDGSVRVYYGATIHIDTSNVEFSGYQTINFKDGKISEIWEWADYGGVDRQINHFLQ